MCRQCGREFRYRVKKKPVLPITCGYVACRARESWGPEDWAGRARMARARMAAGVALDELDREALGRLTERGKVDGTSPVVPDGGA
jgi:ribosomal protein L37E